MKYLKRIDELYKKTYISASDKLKKYHPDRAKELKSHAEKTGIVMPVDRIHPDRFYFNNPSSYDFAKKLQKDEYFSITDLKDRDPSKLGAYLNFDIKFTSTYGNDINLLVNMPSTHYVAKKGFNPDKFKMNIIIDREGSVGRKFLFRSRSEAMSFKKFIGEYLKDEYPDLFKDFNKIGINKFYTTMDKEIDRYDYDDYDEDEIEDEEDYDYEGEEDDDF